MPLYQVGDCFLFEGKILNFIYKIDHKYHTLSRHLLRPDDHLFGKDYASFDYRRYDSMYTDIFQESDV